MASDLLAQSYQTLVADSEIFLIFTSPFSTLPHLLYYLGWLSWPLLLLLLRPGVNILLRLPLGSWVGFLLLLFRGQILLLGMLNWLVLLLLLLSWLELLLRL